MTSQRFYQILADVEDEYILEANSFRRKPLFPGKWLAVAACLCLVCLGVFAFHRLSMPPYSDPTVLPPSLPSSLAASDPSPTQPCVPVFLVNPVDAVYYVDLDVKITPYDRQEPERWAAGTEEFSDALGMTWEDFTTKLPKGYEITGFYSVDAPASPGTENYVTHDYVLEFRTPDGGQGEIALCGEEEPLRDYVLACDAPEASQVGGISMNIYGLGDDFYVQFQLCGVFYDIHTRSIPLADLGALLSALSA